MTLVLKFVTREDAESCRAARVDLGIWTETTTRRFMSGMVYSAIDSGGLVVNSGMNGGLL